MLFRIRKPRAAASSFLLKFVIALLLAAWAIPASAAPKTDIVMFKNGDKLTGELRELKRGRLSLNTDATGTIAIEWDKVAGIISDQHIQVETTSGIRYFGTLTSAEEDSNIIVVTNTGPQSLDKTRIILMSPIEDRGFSALDIDLTLGYNFAKAGGVESGNFGINMHYRSRMRIESFKLTTTVSDSETQEVSRRSNLGFQHTRLWRNRWFSNGSLTFDQNDELGLTLRSSVGGGGGRYLVQSNSMLWSIEGGLQFSRENLEAEPEDVDSVEALLTMKWDWFVFQDPELDWSTTLQIIPSLTESGRVRGELDTSLKWEVIGDLNWTVSIYSTFDNQPKSSAAESTSDYGVNTGLTYDF